MLRRSTLRVLLRARYALFNAFKDTMNLVCIKSQCSEIWHSQVSDCTTMCVRVIYCIVVGSSQESLVGKIKLSSLKA